MIYTYDISAPTTYNSDNNRLMFYETYDTSATPWVPLSTTWYSYNPQGNATRVVTEPASPSLPVQSTRFVYNHSQQVSYIVGEQWYRGNGDCNTYTISYAREFRYDAARARVRRPRVSCCGPVPADHACAVLRCPTLALCFDALTLALHFGALRFRRASARWACSVLAGRGFAR